MNSENFANLNINYYSIENDFPAMRKSGLLAAKVLDFITPYVKTGVATLKLNNYCHEFICDHGATPATLNYRGFPSSTCISVNHVVCHGIPSEKKILKDGDILNIDVTVILDGWYGDTSRMYTVGSLSRRSERLIQTTYNSLMESIKTVKPKAKLGDLGAIIQKHAHKARYSVVEDYCGHGIGKSFHEQPNVLHYGYKGQGLEIKPGMIFTIEPMINHGSKETVTLPDGWTVITKDRQLSAQFEHTIGVTNDGVEIFTKSPKELNCPPYIVL